MYYYKMNIQAWSQSTRGLLPEMEGVYLRLVHHYYDTEQPIQADDRNMLRRLELLAYQELVDEILGIFFEKTDKGWIHGKCDKVLKDYHKTVRKNKLNGAKGGRPKQDGASSISQPEPSGIPVGTQSQPKANPNEERETKNEERRTSTALNKSKRACKKPAVFVAPDTSEVSEYFKTKNLNGDPQHFCDHFENCDWRLSGGRGKKMKDWKLAANNWSRNQSVFDPKSGKGGGGAKLALPQNDEGLQQYAEIHQLSKPRAGENFGQYRGRLNAEIENKNRERGLI